MKMTPTTQTC